MTGFVNIRGSAKVPKFIETRDGINGMTGLK